MDQTLLTRPEFELGTRLTKINENIRDHGFSLFEQFTINYLTSYVHLCLFTTLIKEEIPTISHMQYSKHLNQSSYFNYESYHFQM